MSRDGCGCGGCLVVLAFVLILTLPHVGVPALIAVILGRWLIAIALGNW